MDALYKKILQKQHYHFIGEHTAVKLCGWTKNSITGKGACYKQKFYGINSHRCAQMSPAVNFCNHDCVFCWRERNNSEFDEIDEPKMIADKIEEGQWALINGYGGNPLTDMKKLAEAKEVKHVAISLNGETMAYPKIGELVTELKTKGKSTFLVTNGTFPHKLREMAEKNQLPTQIYVSVEAPTKELYIKIDRPIYEDTWFKLMEFLDVMKEIKHKTRTVMRITLVKGINMVEPEGFAKLIEKAEPTFLEIKGYSFVGASKQRLEPGNSPKYSEVIEFAEQIGKHCDYKYIDGSEPSRVVLYMREDIPDRIMQFD